jgi:hypothetical protein
MSKGHFTATSGAMFVASRLSFEYQLHVELTRDNAPWVDLVVSTEDGSCAAGVQVKAARDAVRMRGREKEKYPSHYEWETGKKLMMEARPDLLVVLVDLKEWREMPDFFVIQAREIQAYYQQWQAEHPGKDPGRWRSTNQGYRSWTFSRTTRRRSSTGYVMIRTRKISDRGALRYLLLT